jgi:hypothetical protein
MTTPIRYIDVPLKNDKTVSVRVINHHPDDNRLWVLYYQADELWSWCEGKSREIGECEDAERLVKLSDLLAQVKPKRDQRLAELLAATLKDKLGDDAKIAEVLSQCTTLDLLEMFEATQGIEPWRKKLLAASQNTPTQDAKLS